MLVSSALAKSHILFCGLTASFPAHLCHFFGHSLSLLCFATFFSHCFNSDLVAAHLTRQTMAPIAVTPPPVEVKSFTSTTRPGIKRVDTANLGTRRKIICFSGMYYIALSAMVAAYFVTLYLMVA
jgi:hypothetical protein